MKRQQFLIKNDHIIDEKFSRPRCLDPDTEFDLQKFMDPDLVCPEMLDPDPVNIRPDPKPWVYVNQMNVPTNVPALIFDPRVMFYL